MSKQRADQRRMQLEHLLEECLEGYEAGLTPEECLSAYPHARAELEPLLRQALSLRIAFASTPAEDFKSKTREKLLFAAGRDAVQAFNKAPRQSFVERTRRKLMTAAGAPAQEALRDVPPPRLPFWSNARRRLLEAATISKPQPAHQYASFGWRTALSAAVVVLAIAMAGLGFMTTGGNGPDSSPPTASANIAATIDKQLTQVEQQQARGESGSSSMLAEIVTLTSNLSTQIDTGNVSSDVIQKLPDLIERQKKAVDIAVASGDAPELAQADQKLDDAQVRVAAAAQNTATPAATSSAIAAVVQPTATSTPLPTTTTTPVASPPAGPEEPATVTGDQIFIGPALGDNTAGVLWTALHTSTIRLVVPSSWQLDPFQIDKNGLAVLTTEAIVVRHKTADHEITVLVSVSNGEVDALIDGQPVQLRSEGPDGTPIDAAKLASVAGADAPLLHHLVESVELLNATPPTPDATATQTSTPTPEATETPTATPTQTPKASPTSTP
ncbi:MAG TPA: hypothetical protein VFY10_05495 [Dehalococcoidia bacterium]|nr:hypothetical protein [Dehalococcoidia bacterium]